MAGSFPATPANFLADENQRANFNTFSSQILRAAYAARSTAKRLSQVRYRPRSDDPSIVSSRSNAISKLKAGIQCASLVGTDPAIVEARKELYGGHISHG